MLNVVISKTNNIYSGTSLVWTPVLRKPHLTDVFLTKRNDHSVKLFINPDIQLPEPDGHNSEPNVKRKEKLLRFTGRR